MLSCSSCIISVAARSSRLSRAQVVEALQELRTFFPEIEFAPSWVATTGDCDLTISLRHLDKTDVFTREIDQMLLKKECRIAIHSAKDLPEPLPDGLHVVALTKGVDTSDSLVFRDGQTLRDLPEDASIGVSCLRREEAVKKILPKARCSDIRGPVDQRLSQLEKGNFDAIVVAEAALIRLGLAHIARIRLEGPVAPMQGRLAIVARKDDGEMQELFACMDEGEI